MSLRVLYETGSMVIVHPDHVMLFVHRVGLEREGEVWLDLGGEG